MNELISDKDLADAFFDEWREIERFRLATIKDLLAICRAMHIVQSKLTEDFVQILVEDKWKEGEVTKHMAGAVMSLMSAIKSLEAPKLAEDIMAVEDISLWEEEVDYGIQ